tara:strand:- start:301 stop:1299 length:999 start_codon:yes stop_codon:yes gene_type:complete
MANGPETPSPTLGSAYQNILNQYAVPYIQNALDTGLDYKGNKPEGYKRLLGRIESGEYVSNLDRDYGGGSPYDPGIGIFQHDEDTTLGDIGYIKQPDNIANLDFDDYQRMYGTNPMDVYDEFRGHYPIPGDEAYTQGGYNFYETNYPGQNIVKRDGKVYTVHPQSGHQTLVADLTTEDPRVSGIPFIPQTISGARDNYKPPSRYPDVTYPSPYDTSSFLTDIADVGTEGSYSTFERAEGVLGEEIQGQELFNIGRETAKWNKIQADLEQQLKMGIVTQEQYDLAINDLFNIHKARADEYMVGRGFSQAGSDVPGMDEANIMNEILDLDEMGF